MVEKGILFLEQFIYPIFQGFKLRAFKFVQTNITFNLYKLEQTFDGLFKTHLRDIILVNYLLCFLVINLEFLSACVSLRRTISIFRFKSRYAVFNICKFLIEFIEIKELFYAFI